MRSAFSTLLLSITVGASFVACSLNPQPEPPGETDGTSASGGSSAGSAGASSTGKGGSSAAGAGGTGKTGGYAGSGTAGSGTAGSGLGPSAGGSGGKSGGAGSNNPAGGTSSTGKGGGTGAAGPGGAAGAAGAIASTGGEGGSAGAAAGTGGTKAGSGGGSGKAGSGPGAGGSGTSGGGGAGPAGGSGTAGSGGSGTAGAGGSGTAGNAGNGPGGCGPALLMGACDPMAGVCPTGPDTHCSVDDAGSALCVVLQPGPFLSLGSDCMPPATPADDVCEVGTVCRTGGLAPAQAQCEQVCETSCACGTGNVCARIAPSVMGSWGVCVPTCSPLTVGACAAGATCATMPVDPDVGSSFAFSCRAVGATALGAACQVDTDCVADAMCVGSTCRPLCNATVSCVGGASCDPLPQVGYGTCSP